MAFRRRNKSYPLFSQEFFIQNHADVVFCLVVCVLVGLMFETSAHTSFLFILPQYNISSSGPEGQISLYRYGWRDFITLLFYLLVNVLLHAGLQECILEKVSRRLHLSKSRNTKWSESAQLCVFYSLSSVWTLHILITQGYLLNVRSLWESYPHTHLSFQVKFYYLFQLSYWLHTLPELYFQKVRKEEVPRHLQHICLYLIHISLAYLLHLTRVGLVLLFPQYLSELGFHTSRLVYFIDERRHKLFDVCAVGFVVSRMTILTLLFLVVGFGLARVDGQCPDWEKGNFNTLLVRLTVLLLVCVTQSWILWRFVCFQLRRWRKFTQENRRLLNKQASRMGKKETGYSLNGAARAENGGSPRAKKLKAA